MLRLRAAHVHPVTASPIADGAVLVDDAGRIAALGPHPHVPTPPDGQVLEFADAVLVPGLVNCHTHLELTHLAGCNAAPDFADWIRRVRELKEASTPEQFAAGAERGLRDCWARGVTCIAETGSTGVVLEALARLGGRGLVYHEVFGPDPARCEASLAELEAAIVRLTAWSGDTVRLGVSPHAPYTVSAPLYRGVGELARLERLPVALHLAESPAETALVRDGAGPFAERLRARGIAVAASGRTPVRYVAETGALDGALAIHCVQVDEADIAELRARGAAVAACPRSNRAHGHGDPPLERLRAAGVPVGFGTDSTVSVPDLDLWAEAEAAGLTGEPALRALTFEGARALGWEDEIGSLAPGKSADLAVFRPHPSSPVLPRSGPALLTVVAGRIVHRAA
jgi:5-methylthioadenosine/S-adenosylhomocysteine deaminase